MSTSNSPTLANARAVAILPFRRAVDRPLAMISRLRITTSSSASIPRSTRIGFSRSMVGASGAKTASIRAELSPVRTTSLVARAPSTAPSASSRIDFPAPVSPVRTFRPSENWMLVSSIMAKFRMDSSSSIAGCPRYNWSPGTPPSSTITSPYSIPASTSAARIGRVVIRAPTASRIAFATAAAPGIAGGSPTPLAP